MHCLQSRGLAAPNKMGEIKQTLSPVCNRQDFSWVLPPSLEAESGGLEHTGVKKKTEQYQETIVKTEEGEGNEEGEEKRVSS